MPRPARFRSHPFHVFAAVALVLSLDLIAAAQSSTTKKPALTLDVLSAEYLPDTDTIRVKLINHSKKTATAYGIDISVLSNGKVLSQSGRASDLLNLFVSQQCGAGSKDSLAAIQPGEIEIDSQPANFDKTQLTTPEPEIHVTVVGIIWSDGTVEGDPKNPSGTLAMNRMQKQREKDASDEAKIISILDEHQDDPDIHHRIREITEAVAALATAPPAQTENADPVHRRYTDARSPVFTTFLTNLQISESSPSPKETFEAITSFLACTHKERVAMLPPAAPAEAQLH